MPALLVLLASWVPLDALAQDDADARARIHFDSARVHFDEGAYDAARAEFAAAYELSHRDGLLYNLYLCEERLGHPIEAADFLERFLHTSAVPEAERATLERRLVHLRERVVAAPAPGPPPEPTPAPAPGGDHDVLLGVGIGTLAAGGAALIAMAVLGGLAAAEDGRVAAACGASAGRVCTDAELQTLGDLSVGADVALTAGLVLSAAGAGLVIAGAVSGDAERPRAWLAPTAGGVQVVVGGAL